MKTTQSLLSLALIAFLTYLAFFTQRPISVHTATDGGYSAENVRRHIEVMAAEPHFIGSQENEKVRDYIVAQFKQLGIEAVVEAQFVQQRRPGNAFMRLAKPENIIARLKGKGTGKAVMVMGHYDSVLNSPGAGDDVHAVANILETARILAAEERENDIIFLITDGEERGLFGAEAYAENHDLSEIGVLLNYEARGNSGQSISFEWSDGNAWLVKQLRKVGKRPIANSMSYEIYDRMPNGSDFTIFKDEGVPGINNAFIGGFSYYHSPDDSPERLDYRSVQHSGENMLRLTRHFANLDLSNVKSQNASFFNLFGLLIIYPVWLDTVLILLSIVAWLILLMGWIKNKKMTAGQWLLSFAGILVAIGLAVGAAMGLGSLIYGLYPHYEVFYAGQYYNHEWYLLAVVGLSTVLLWLSLSRLQDRLGMPGLQMAYVTLVQVLLLCVYFLAPTATYIMAIPLLGLYLALFLSNETEVVAEGGETVWKGILTMLLPIGFWTVATFLIYLAFSLSLLPGPVLFCGLFVLASAVAFPSWWQKSSRILPYTGIALFVGAMLIAHIQSKPTEAKPLPSDLFHFSDVDADEAFWATNDRNINIGNAAMLEGAQEVDLEIPWSIRRWAVSSEMVEGQRLPQLQLDSTGTQAVLKSQQSPLWTTLMLENPHILSHFRVQGQAIENMTEEGVESSFIISAYGIGLNELRLAWEKKDTAATLNIIVSTRLPGLPAEDKIPENSMRRGGYSLIKKKISL